ncbi:TonB-dependent receptor [Limibacter armeniacum]|uniref:TonB-dependent receptor n=1 Tax=Limibacter armeniacum TaxID=466084 RepID=UPI002FE51A16
MKQLLLTLLLFFAVQSLWAQSAILKGKLEDTSDHTPLIGATLLLIDQQDTTKRIGTITDTEGFFNFKNVKPNSYKLQVKYVGYKTIEQVLKLEAGINDVKTVQLSEDKQLLKEVVVEDKTSPAIVKGDTVQYNASAYKVNADATTEDLLKKMSGITVENGELKAQGESVQKVLVDGKTFFGNDPSIAMKNLPANVIDKVEVYDKKSDQAQFSGVDDGNSAKTINIVTKEDKRKGKFGKVYAGYGTDNRFGAGGNVNVFDGDRRFSVLGLSNNVNQQNFAMEDLMSMNGSGGGGRGFGRGLQNFRVGGQEGISTTNAIGLNYSDNWGEKVEVTGSYFFNHAKNENRKSLYRQYFSGNNDGQFYDELSEGNSTNLNHRFNFELEYKINENNSLKIRPRLSVQQNESNNFTVGKTFLTDGTILNSTDNYRTTDSQGYSFSNSLLWRHSFTKKGRTFSIDINTDVNGNDRDNTLNANNVFGDSEEVVEQQSSQENTKYELSAKTVYTEPISEHGKLVFEYEIGYANSYADRKTYDYQNGERIDVDSLLSNTFDNDYLTQEGGIKYNFSKGRDMDFTIGADVKRAELMGNQTFPINNETDYIFTNVLPNLRLKVKLGKNNNLHFRYRARTNAPSINQLQNVVDNSNPIRLSSGNPNLEQEYSNSGGLFYHSFNMEKGSSFFMMLGFDQVNNQITNSTIIASEDMELADGTTLKQGASFTQPINMDGYWSINSNINYGVSSKLIKSKINFSTGLSYSKKPGMVGGEANETQTISVWPGVSVSSNISEKVDFTISSYSGYNVSESTLQPELDNKYFSLNSSFDLNLLFWKGFVFNNKLNHMFYSGLSDDVEQNYMIWNMSLGKKFLEKNRGELKIGVYDLLNQNTSVGRNVTETYSEDTQNLALGRYFMLTFSYRLNKFGDDKPKGDRMRMIRIHR